MSQTPSDDVARLYGFVKRGAVDARTLCDKLDISPKRLEALLRQARAQGVAVQVEHDHIGLKPDSAIERADVQTTIAPASAEEQKIGVISDTHLGSKYCLRAQLRDFIEQAYALGVREILHPGDILDGDYRHAKFEMSHMGIEDQTQDLFETLPQKKGLRYFAISGNHDFTFTDASGINTTRFIQAYFRDRGRNDFVGIGDRSAFIRARGALVHLWHPRSGVGYAVSYPLQRKVAAYAPGQKPHILLTGHWHTNCYVVERGVHAIACPTFQGGQSAFGKSLGGSAPSIGGLILRWHLTEHGTLRRFAVERHSYYEREGVHQVDHTEGDLVE